MSTIMHLIHKIWTALLVLHSLSPAPALCQGDAEILFEHGEPIENGQQEPNNTYYNDITHFQGGLNAWDFMGMWSKYDLLSLDEDVRPIPINPLRPDQAVFICHTSALPSVMEKTFPPLEKVNLTLGYYLSSQDMDLMMSGTVEVGEKTEEIFNYSSPIDTHELNDSWVTQHFHLSGITKEGDFTLKFILRSLSDNKTKILRDIWATDEVVVEGFKVTSLPIVGTEQPNPESNATSPNPDSSSTEPAVETSVTSGINETNVGTNVTTVASNVTVGTNETSVGTNVTVNQNETSNVTESGAHGNVTTEEPEGPEILGPSSFIESNVTDIPSGNMTAYNSSNVPQENNSNSTENPPSNVSQETISNSTGNPSSNATQIPPDNFSKSPEGNETSNQVINVSHKPQANVSYPHGTNVTYGAGSNTTQESGVPQGNYTGDTSDNSTGEPPNQVSGAPPSNVSQETPINVSSGPPSNFSEPPFGSDPKNPIDDQSPNYPDYENKGGFYASFVDDVSKLASVADAIWNAFYVFLALFCACLIALVGLIVRGRCKDNDNPPPSVATYNPRTASYRLDKVYDNAGYDTNAV